MERPAPIELRADELRQAIEGDELSLYFQPIVSLADRSATMLEALPRWSHAVHGILAPQDFIALAEESGLLAPLEHWAIRAAVRHLERSRSRSTSPRSTYSRRTWWTRSGSPAPRPA